jgi:hypothetical protein
MWANRLLKVATLATIAFGLVKADDLQIYSDGSLAAGWENWSWSSTIDFAATDLFVGTSSISVNSTQWAALSVKLEGTFPTYAGLRFDIAVRRHTINRRQILINGFYRERNLIYRF